MHFRSCRPREPMESVQYQRNESTNAKPSVAFKREAEFLAIKSVPICFDTNLNTKLSPNANSFLFSPTWSTPLPPALFRLFFSRNVCMQNNLPHSKNHFHSLVDHQHWPLHLHIYLCFPVQYFFFNPNNQTTKQLFFFQQQQQQQQQECLWRFVKHKRLSKNARVLWCSRNEWPIQSPKLKLSSISIPSRLFKELPNGVRLRNQLCGVYSVFSLIQPSPSCSTPFLLDSTMPFLMPCRRKLLLRKCTRSWSPLLKIRKPFMLNPRLLSPRTTRPGLSLSLAIGIQWLILVMELILTSWRLKSSTPCENPFPSFLFFHDTKESINDFYLFRVPESPLFASLDGRGRQLCGWKRNMCWQPAMLKWAVENGCLLREAKEGRPNILHWLKAHGAWPEATCAGAASGGHLEL